MADYKQIPNDYAKVAVNAGILINGGAAVATLSQAVALLPIVNVTHVAFAMLLWAAGAVAAAATSAIGFYSTRLYDNFLVFKDQNYRESSNKWMKRGLVAISFSYAAFVVGCGLVAWSIVFSTPATGENSSSSTLTFQTIKTEEKD